MEGRARRRVAAPATLVALVLAAPASTHPVERWTASPDGERAWQATRASCGVVGEEPSLVRAHTRWRTSPANGYMRVIVTREVEDASTGAWRPAHRTRRSTRNGDLEGTRAAVHWTQWFFPFEDEAGLRSRHTVVFEWRRDRSGRPDRLVRRRALSFAPCVVGG